MDDSYRPKFAVSLAGLREMLGGQPLSEPAIRGFWMALGDLTEQQFERAVTRAARELKWFPKPVELIELAIGTGADRMTEAWRHLNKALDLYGTAHGFTFDDPKLVAAVQAMGGLSTMAQMSKKEFASFGWHRFKEIYGSAGEENDRVVVFLGGKRLAIVDGRPLRAPTVKRIAADGQLAKPCIESVKQCGQTRPRGITHVSELTK